MISFLQSSNSTRVNGYLSNRQVEVVEGVLEKNGFDVEAIREAAKRET